MVRAEEQGEHVECMRAEVFASGGGAVVRRLDDRRAEGMVHQEGSRSRRRVGWVAVGMGEELDVGSEGG